MLDNEMKSKRKKPIGNFIHSIDLGFKKREALEEECMVHIMDNLYLLTVPLIGGKSECDIEDLFDDVTLSHEIGGRKFTKSNNYNVSTHYGKEIFSSYILKAYDDINFIEFRPVLDNINSIVNIYSKEYENKEYKSKKNKQK